MRIDLKPQARLVPTRPEILPFTASGLHQRTLSSRITCEAQWASIHVLLSGQPGPLPVAQDPLTGALYTDTDWRLLTLLDDPKVGVGQLQKLVQAGASPLVRYPSSAGPCGGAPFLYALTRTSHLPASAIASLIERAAKKISLVDVHHRNGTLVDAALDRHGADGVLLAEWLIGQHGLRRSEHRDTAAASFTRLLHTRLYWPTWAESGRIKPLQMAHQAGFKIFAPVIQFAGLRLNADGVLDEASTEALFQNTLARFDATAMLRQPITRSLTANDQLVFQGPIGLYLLQEALKADENKSTVPALTFSQCGWLRDLILNLPSETLGATIVLKSGPTSLGALLDHRAAVGRSSRLYHGFDEESWNRFMAALSHRLLLNHAPNAVAMTSHRARL